MFKYTVFTSRFLICILASAISSTPNTFNSADLQTINEIVNKDSTKENENNAIESYILFLSRPCAPGIPAANNVK